MNNTIQRYEIRPKTEKGKVKRCIRIPGVDYGAPLVIIEESDKRILCSRAGHQSWKGLGTWGYTEPEFFIFEKIEENVSTGGIEVEGTGYGFEYDRQSKKEVFQKALDYFRR